MGEIHTVQLSGMTASITGYAHFMYPITALCIKYHRNKYSKRVILMFYKGFYVGQSNFNLLNNHSRHECHRHHTLNTLNLCAKVSIFREQAETYTDALVSLMEIFHFMILQSTFLMYESTC